MQKISTLILFICAMAGICAAQNSSTAIISGFVNTADGQPAAGVTISLGNGKRQTVSDKEGFFSLKGLSAGKYIIHVSSVGLKPVDQEIVLREGETIEVTLTLYETANVLQEVIVSAQREKLLAKNSDDVAKMPLDRLENPQVYSTVTQELMHQQLVFNMEDALKNVPGVTKLWDAVGRAGIGGSYFNSRGFSVQPQLRNGIAGNISSGIDLANTELVEAVKGPSATLFGNNLTSYGGLINRVTKKPFDHFGGAVSYSAGSYGYNRLAADVNTPLDKDGKVLLRLNGAYLKEKSWQDYGFRNSFTLAPSLSYEVNNKLSFLFDAEYTNTEQAGMAQIIYFMTPSSLSSTISGLVASLPQLSDSQKADLLASMPKTALEAYGVNHADDLNLNYKRSYNSNSIVNHNSNANFIAQMNYEISSEWKSQTVVSQTNSQSNGDMPYFYLVPNFVTNLLATAMTTAPSFGSPGYDKLMRNSWRPIGNDHSLEIQQNFSGDFKVGEMRNRVVVGFDYFENSLNLAYQEYVGKVGGLLPYATFFDFVNTSGSVPNYGYFNSSKIDSAYAASPVTFYNSYSKKSTYSAYVSDVFNITEQLLINAALRFDRFVNKGSYSNVTGEYAGGYHQNALAPKFGIVFQPVKDQLSLFGNYQSGFTNTNGQAADGSQFKPEQAIQWEGGIKTDLFQSRLSATVSYYDIKVKNVIRGDINNPNFSIQDGNQKNSGVEAEVIASPVTGLSLIAGYAYSKSVLEDADASVEGLRPVASGPEHSANLWLNYQFSNRSLKGFGVGFGGNYAGDAFAINNHNDGQFILPAYTVLNAALSYDCSKFRFGAKLNNLANKKYWVGWTTMNPQMPRQLLASIEYKF